MTVLETLRRRFTRDEYLKMAEAGVFGPWERVQLIAGEIIRMTPQGSLHATGICKVDVTLRLVFPSGYQIRIQLPLDLGRYSQPEPDLAVVRGSYEDFRDAHPTAAVLVVEISDATLDLDRREKAAIYAEANIPEYWIVNLADRILEVQRDPAPGVGPGGGHGYRTILRLTGGDYITPLGAPQTRIPVGDLLP